MSRRAAAAFAVAALALAAGGCAGDNGNGSGETLTVYVSAPLHGERAAEGRAIVNGAKLALADAGGRVGGIDIRAVYLDDTLGNRWSPVRTAENARRAAEDSTAIGYIGDLDSGATRTSLPITNQAEMVQISPGSTAVDLTRLPPVGRLDPERYQPSDTETFARVVPDDEVQARGAALWAQRLGGRRASIVSDETQFGRIVADAFSEQASGLGMDVSTIRTGQRGTEGLPQTLSARHPDVVYLAATPELATPLLVAADQTTAQAVIAPDSLAVSSFRRRAGRFASGLRVTTSFRDPSTLPPEGQSFLRDYRARFGHPAGPAAAYGYESMDLLLDAIRRAGNEGDQRDAVIDQVLSTPIRRSVVGDYSIDGNGDTTLDAISGYTVRAGRPVFSIELVAPG